MLITVTSAGITAISTKSESCEAAGLLRFPLSNGVLRSMGAKVAIGFHGVLPLPMGMEREDRHD